MFSTKIEMQANSNAKATPDDSAQAVPGNPKDATKPPAPSIGGDIAVAPLGDAPERSAQGLALSIETLAPVAGKNNTDTRSVRMVAIYVQDGTPPTPFLPAGPFRATWSGDLSVSIRDEYTFSADGNGAVKLELNGETVLDASGNDLSQTNGKAIKLKKGKNHLVAHYESPKKGDAYLRMCWSTSDFPREVLSTIKLSHDIDARPLRESRRLRTGRELFASLRCAHCHDAKPFVPSQPDSAAQADSLHYMPELDLDAPELNEIGDRLNAAWIAQWVADPRALRPEATMPKLLHGAGVEKDSLDIAAFLATCTAAEKPQPTKAPEPEFVAAGGEIFATLGCIGCHTLPSAPPIKEELGGAGEVAARIPLRNVRRKWKAAALPAFLHQPNKHYAWIRMPNFRLSDDEAAKLAAFVLYQLIDDNSPAPELKSGADAEHGKKLVESSGCLNCHTLSKASAQTASAKGPAIKDIPAAGWLRGCMASAPANAPDFLFSKEQQQALLAFAATDKASLMSEAGPEFSERRLRALRCAACHSRDDQEDHWSANEQETDILLPKTPPKENADAQEGEANKFRQLRPALTWIGEKLKPEWMTTFIKGEVPYKPRPWVHARMPGFTQAAFIARGLALEHGCEPVTPLAALDPVPDEAMSTFGKRLVGKREGLACTACHDVGKTAAVGVFEAPGINFMYVKPRLRKSYFLRWISDPLRVEPNTKMPKFATDGRTQITEILGGDANKQFEALWQYMQNGDKITSPESDEN